MNTARIDSKALYEVLKGKGVQCFYHANTVKTSLTFIKEQALLSRGYVEGRGLYQTEQYTDKKDKMLGIWDAVFLDGTDLHKKFVTRNKYGPVLFQVSLELLKSSEFSTVRITKSNPDSWASAENRFYESIEDVDKDYLTGNKLRDARIMFLFDNPKKEVKLNQFCKEITIDDPRVILTYSNGTQKAISERVKKIIRTALEKSCLEDIEVEVRHPTLDLCKCYHQYKNMYEYNKEYFDKLFSK